MLDESETVVVQRHGHLWDHAWRYFSLLAGEPFLIGGAYLAHADGANVYFNGHPLDAGLASCSPAEALGQFAASMKPVVVWYSGPERVGESVLSQDLVARGATAPDEADVCMTVDLTEWRHEDDRRRRHRINQARRRGLRAVVQESGILTVRHLALMDEFVSRVNPGSFARSMLARLGAFARLDGVVLLDIIRDGQLVAFAVIETWFETTDLFIYGFADRSEPAAGDYLQYSIVENVRSRGKTSLNVGYSLNEDLKTFKEKWGARAVTDGYWDQVWSQCAEDIRGGYCHWPQRLIDSDPQRWIPEPLLGDT